MFHYYLLNPGTTFCRAVMVFDSSAVPEGVVVHSSDDYFAGESHARREVSNAWFSIQKPHIVCGFCGGAAPCTHDD